MDSNIVMALITPAICLIAWAVANYFIKAQQEAIVSDIEAREKTCLSHMVTDGERTLYEPAQGSIEIEHRDGKPRPLLPAQAA
jgi:hypothetical protein